LLLSYLAINSQGHIWFDNTKKWMLDLPTTQYRTGKTVEAEGEVYIDIKISLQVSLAWTIKDRG
jgi:hypothetical protein